jgi:2-oxoglutarate ferredoxin oxidoreductase subunit gamma
MRMAGFGGQGIITTGKILGRAAVLYDQGAAVLTEDYGPEKMGGWSKADLVISEKEIRYPLVEKPDIFIAMAQDAFDRFHETMKPDGQALFEKGLVHPTKEWSRRTSFIPALQAAEKLGRKVVANIVMIGALVELTDVVTHEAAREAILDSVPEGTEKLNEEAFRKGGELARGGGS